MRCRKVSSRGVPARSLCLIRHQRLQSSSKAGLPGMLHSAPCSPSDTKTGQPQVLLAFCTLVFADSPFPCLSFRPTAVPLQETPSLTNYVMLIHPSTSYQSHLSSRMLEAFLESVACVHTSGSGMRASRHLAYEGSESLLSLVTLGRLTCWLNGSKTPLVISNLTHLSLG